MVLLQAFEGRALIDRVDEDDSTAFAVNKARAGRKRRRKDV
jgi:hypothetical protein